MFEAVMNLIISRYWAPIPNKDIRSIEIETYSISSSCLERFFKMLLIFCRLYNVSSRLLKLKKRVRVTSLRSTINQSFLSTIVGKGVLRQRNSPVHGPLVLRLTSSHSIRPKNWLNWQLLLAQCRNGRVWSKPLKSKSHLLSILWWRRSYSTS
jgi:hypothetical protein